MSVSFWQDIGMTKQVTSKFDITIIGGGIAGLSCAYWLLKEDKGLRVALVEKNQIGAGASGRNAGFITCGSVEHFNRLVSTHGESQALEIWNFSETNLMLLKSELLSVNPEECDFEQKGSFSLASTEQEYQELKQTYVCMQKLNIEVEQLNQSEIKKCLGVDHFVGGIKYIKDAAINPMKLLQKLKKSLLLNYNFSLYENHEVFDIQTQGDSKVVKANNNYLSSSAVIMATNGYLPLFDDYFKDKIFPTKGQILTTTSVPQFMLGPCYANFVLDYFRQLKGGEIIIGGFRQLEKLTQVGYSDEISPVIQQALEQFLAKHLPILKQSQITHRWSGVMGFSVDGQPLIGSLPTDNQVFFLGGFTAHGLGLAFHSAKCLVDLIYGRETPAFISAKRF